MCLFIEMENMKKNRNLKPDKHSVNGKKVKRIQMLGLAGMKMSMS